MANYAFLGLRLSIFTFLLFLSSNLIQTHSQQFSTRLSKNEVGLKAQKLSHLHFYFHDIVSGRHPTAVRVAEAAVTNSSATGFGLVVMIDDPLTLGPNISSKIVGRAQGIYGSADLSNLGLLMVLNFAFTEGKFNGSTLSVLGRNEVFSAVRELPIVGGSGVFRFAKGYAEARTHELDLKTGDAVVEYNVYAGSGIGGMLSAVHGIPYVQTTLRGRSGFFLLGLFPFSFGSFLPSNVFCGKCCFWRSCVSMSQPPGSPLALSSSVYYLTAL
ncbi:Dirigent protein 21 [Sesamum alatum]|uniref:Dirigent protein n=1 Tax=Sesamum alatum TaxID=300844 RepID=A0AAE1YLJ8_9LAMI|nr:Dirigent protein 21 [Sesamum alatum]